MRRSIAGMLFAAVFMLGTAAAAKPVKYAGIHPRTGNPSDGLCYIQFVHVHPYAPANANVLYRMHAGAYFFIGDPAPFGYDGPRHQYYGPHPVEIDVVLGDDGNDHQVEYCYLEGPHFHAYAPPPDQKFAEKDDVYYYADPYPPAYEQAKPELARINVIYRPWTYVRPAIVGPPPPAYRGPIVAIEVVPVPAVGVQVVPVPVHEHVKYKHFKHKKFKWKD